MARKNSKALKIAVHELFITTYLQKRQELGDVIHIFGEGRSLPDGLESYDVVLGPNMWRVLEGNEKLIEVAMSSARNVKFSPKKRSKDEEDDDDA